MAEPRWAVLAWAGAPERRVSISLTAVLVLLCFDRLWVTEDAYITFRSVENLWSGHGPNFNRGLRVESFSHPLWFLVLCVLRGAGAGSLPLLAAVLGVALTAGGFVLAGLAGRRLPEGPALPLGLVAFLSLPPAWDFASSGLETGLTFAWIGMCAWLLARPLPAGAGPAALLGLAPLIRPDLTVLAAPPLALLLVRRRTGAPLRLVLRDAVAFLAPGAAWQVFRMGYYGLLVPNTWLAKEGLGARWDQGWRYFWDLFGLYGLFVVLPIGTALAIPGWRRAPAERARALALLAGAALHGGFVVRAGGDFMHGRLLLPALFATCAALSWVPLAGGRLARQLTSVLLLLWSVVVALGVRPSYGSDINGFGVTDEREWYVQRARTARPVDLDDYRAHSFSRVGHAMADLCRKNGARAAYWAHIGLTVAAMPDDLTVIDPLALNDHIGSHVELRTRGRPGHEKMVRAAWFLARYPPGLGFVVRQQLGGFFDKPEPAEAIAAARRVLQSPRLRELDEAVAAKLTPGLFLRNLLRAPRLTALRIPPDPLEAERRFLATGAGSPPPR
jgi:arabinofuranosyltransferase